MAKLLALFRAMESFECGSKPAFSLTSAPVDRNHARNRESELFGAAARFRGLADFGRRSTPDSADAPSGALCFGEPARGLALQSRLPVTRWLGQARHDEERNGRHAAQY